MVIPNVIVQLFSAFQEVFTAPTFRNVVFLFLGFVVCRNGLVSAALRAMGADQDKGFGKYHGIFSRAVWSCLMASQVLLGIIVASCLMQFAPLMLVVDDTLERRKGQEIRLLGWYYDAARSIGNVTNKSPGIRWLSIQILVAVPWSKRLWSLPFMTVPAPTKKTCIKLNIKHQSCVDITCVLMGVISRWHPNRTIFLMGDGAFAAVKLLERCNELGVIQITKGRLDMRLYDLPGEQPKGKRGPKRKKGKRQPSLKSRAENPSTIWEKIAVRWYGLELKVVEVITDTSLWHRSGLDPVEIKWVVVRYKVKGGKYKTICLISTDLHIDVTQMIENYVNRWNIETTFSELREYLGFEKQRKWSDKSINRMVPCLFGVYSLVVIIAMKLYPEELPNDNSSAWYKKENASFGDVLATVRMYICRVTRHCYQRPVP